MRVQAHAFGPELPHRSLHLSPDHVVVADGALIPVRHLCNGATVQQKAATAVIYFHVELDAHDILLAEGLPAESFLETGNRGAFGEPPARKLSLGLPRGLIPKAHRFDSCLDVRINPRINPRIKRPGTGMTVFIYQ